MYMKWAKMEAKKCSNSKYSRITVGKKTHFNRGGAKYGSWTYDIFR